MAEYCQKYNTTTLECDRKQLLSSASIKYETYLADYISKTKKQLKAIKNGEIKLLTKSQIKIIKIADKMESPNITPAYILRQSEGLWSKKRRVAPQNKLMLLKVKKLFSSVFVSVASGAIVLDMITDFSFAKFVEATVKVAPILLSAYTGYKAGYNNIYVDTVSYINDQSTHLNNYIKWVNTNPINKEKPKDCLSPL